MIRFFSSNRSIRNASANELRIAAAASCNGITLNKATTTTTACRHQSTTTNGSVAIQLDYYMSPQFAGIACAMTEGLYEQAGIMDLKFLPICPVGTEMAQVRQFRRFLTSRGDDDSASNRVVVGSVEQNIFTPLLYQHPDLKVKAIASMFRTSPLCLASIIDNDDQKNSNDIVVGAHDDTVPLLTRMLKDYPNYQVVGSPRASKNTDLLEGKYDAIQAYTTTEVPTLERLLHQQGRGEVRAIPLEGLNGAKLGYSQLLFTPEEDLIVGTNETTTEKREVLHAFLEATFQGWDMAIRNNDDAAERVGEAQRMLQLDDEQNDHSFAPGGTKSKEYTIQNVGLCCDYVKETFQGDKYGIIDSYRWNEATKWLTEDATDTYIPHDFGFDASLWKPSSEKLLAGNELARESLEKAKDSAIDFAKAHKGRKPSLLVVTVGDEHRKRYNHGTRRKQIYSNDRNSWFSKTQTGANNGFDVQELQLPTETTTEELITILKGNLKNIDGIQLMWPLPSHIDSLQAYNAIPIDRDIDGAHYLGQMEKRQNHQGSGDDDGESHKVDSPIPPVTPAATMELFDHYQIDVAGKHVVVVGRSRIVGSPLAHMLRDRDAIVTQVHSKTSPEKLQQLVGMADVVVTCVGEPGVLDPEWLTNSDGVVVVNVGTTFSEQHDGLLSDFGEHGDAKLLANDQVQYFSPVPGGVGPLSVAQLYRNVVRAAWRRSSSSSSESSSSSSS
mmetsp:Transcript_48986/g.55505  ORF Transcript_48986/g.55505 Transcript_48986/m.55505 type:complete len:725 (+) Transcript_48986:282-2456(+)